MANFTAFASREDQSMQNILILLQELDTLHNQDSLELYEKQWKVTAKLILQLSPVFTIANAT
jgi:hypothetical protein